MPTRTIRPATAASSAIAARVPRNGQPVAAPARRSADGTIHLPTRPALTALTMVTALLLLFPAHDSLAAAPHQHGVAQMRMAVEGADVEIEFIAPLDSLIGFEHAPRNETERKALANLKDTFSQPRRVLSLTAAASCVAGPVEISLPDAKTQPHDHAELAAVMPFRCASPAALKDIELTLFDAFPRLRRVDLQVAAPARQTGASLSPRQPRLNW